MRVVPLLFFALLVFLFLSTVSCAGLTKKSRRGGDAARFLDCDSCVAAGYGWSWEEEECGTFVNTDCTNPNHPANAGKQEEHSSSNYESAIDTDSDASDSPSPRSASSSSSSPHSALDDDDDDDFIAADDDDDAVPSGPKTFSWADTEATTHIWSLVNRGDYEAMQRLLDQDEDVVRYRSKDGRGALFWAYEYGHDDMADLLIAHGADTEAKDASGKRPSEMRQPGHDDL